MSPLERRWFVAFLALYLVSSLLFTVLVGYWYFRAQKKSIETETFYRMQHIADTVAGKIISAHMQGGDYPIPESIEGVRIEVIGVGEDNDTKGVQKEGFYLYGDEAILVSDAPQEHLGVKRLILQTHRWAKRIELLRKQVWIAMAAAFVMISLVAWALSKLFMRPIRERVASIERFVNDTAHELNTPITSISMIVDQALKQNGCDERMLRNLSIGIKQLHDIYRSLTYLCFDVKTQTELMRIDTALQKTIEYYTPIAESKKIALVSHVQTCDRQYPKEELTLLFGNLISNAIKYSHRSSTVHIKLEACRFEISDEGIGIEKQKQAEVFERFRRAQAYGGGFGVGLWIVKSICDRYRLALRLESEKGKGTRIQIDFV